jgi:putative oxidoreductase
MHAIDVAALLLRVTVGVTMPAHGWNHIFGGGPKSPADDHVGMR